MLGALALATTNVLSADAAAAAAGFAQKAIETSQITLSSKAVFAGLIVAGVVWVDTRCGTHLAARVDIHLVSGDSVRKPLPRRRLCDGDVLSGVHRELALSVGLWQFVLPVLLGNSVGGVVLVTVSSTSVRLIGDSNGAGRSDPSASSSPRVDLGRMVRLRPPYVAALTAFALMTGYAVQPIQTVTPSSYRWFNSVHAIRQLLLFAALVLTVTGDRLDWDHWCRGNTRGASRSHARLSRRLPRSCLAHCSRGRSYRLSVGWSVADTTGVGSEGPGVAGGLGSLESIIHRGVAWALRCDRATGADG